MKINPPRKTYCIVLAVGEAKLGFEEETMATPGVPIDPRTQQETGRVGEPGIRGWMRLGVFWLWMSSCTKSGEKRSVGSTPTT